MRTHIDLDETLLEEAFRYAKVSTKKDLVHLALREFISNHRRLDVRELRGTGGLIETLVRPHVASQDLAAAYRDMAADEDREAEAQEWAEATARDVADEAR